MMVRKSSDPAWRLALYTELGSPIGLGLADWDLEAFWIINAKHEKPSLESRVLSAQTGSHLALMPSTTVEASCPIVPFVIPLAHAAAGEEVECLPPSTSPLLVSASRLPAPASPLLLSNDMDLPLCAPLGSSSGAMATSKRDLSNWARVGGTDDAELEGKDALLGVYFDSEGDCFWDASEELELDDSMDDCISCQQHAYHTSRALRQDDKLRGEKVVGVIESDKKCEASSFSVSLSWSDDELDTWGGGSPSNTTEGSTVGSASGSMVDSAEWESQDDAAALGTKSHAIHSSPSLGLALGRALLPLESLSVSGLLPEGTPAMTTASCAATPWFKSGKVTEPTAVDSCPVESISSSSSDDSSGGVIGGSSSSSSLEDPAWQEEAEVDHSGDADPNEGFCNHGVSPENLTTSGPEVAGTGKHILDLIPDSDLTLLIQSVSQEEEDMQHEDEGRPDSGRKKDKAQSEQQAKADHHASGDKGGGTRKASSTKDKEKGKGWRMIMSRHSEHMQYSAWVRDCGSHFGGMEFRGRMLLMPPVQSEDQSGKTKNLKGEPGVSGSYNTGVQRWGPEAVRDFLLDEVHRAEWDDSREASEMLEEWDQNGCSTARWVRRLPLFLRSREYVVGRRVWGPEAYPRSYFCISKGMDFSGAPRQSHLVRVSSFFSSWRVRPLSLGETDQLQQLLSKSSRGGKRQNSFATTALKSLYSEANKNGDQPGAQVSDKRTKLREMEAVEVITHHEEESGLPRDLVRMGVAHRMWGHMSKMEGQLRRYCASGRNLRHVLPVSLLQAEQKANAAVAASLGAEILQPTSGCAL